jgi:hypothetical protein
MGGVSQATASLEEVEGIQALRLQGTVSLDRGGGFIQMARTLDKGGEPLDGSDHRGIAVTVHRGGTDVQAARIRAQARGPEAPATESRDLRSSTEGEHRYFLHLRTPQTRAPWAHFSAPLAVTDRWSTTLVTWSQFEPQGLRVPLDTSELLRLGVVAGQAAFEADLAVAWVGLV